MKVLLSHNHYSSFSPSGEGFVFEAEKELLVRKGIEVVPFEKHNEKFSTYSFLSKVGSALGISWSLRVYEQVKVLLEVERPDITHFHNIFYSVSPSAYYACKSAGVPIVQTLHNFRFFCVNGLLAKNGQICEDCLGKLPWKGVLDGCYRDSRLYSLPIALMEGLHKLVGTWEKKINAYIALTEFARKKFIECGLPAEKIFVKPNFLSNPPEPNYANHGYAVFLGRLSPEKGLSTLIHAFGNMQILNSESFILKVIGDGPLLTRLEDKIRDEDIANIQLIGRKERSECMDILKGARFMIMPSICYEGFPMALIEAFACGKSVIASNLGAMASIVEEGRTGLLFEPGNPEDLASKIVWMLENEDACIEMGRNARRVFEAKYTAEKNYEILINIYRTVIENKREGLYD
jgi:glycosyltransferase involved in cell wall biosynthesis